MQPIISLRSPKLRFTGVCIENPFEIDIPAGVTAVIGPNGSGKSALGRIIEGGWNFMTNDIVSHIGRRLKVNVIEFSDIHSLTGFKVEYYQQRFESTMNDEVPTVSELLGDHSDTPGWDDIARALQLDRIADKRINFLSSGELRKMLIANMLTDLPEVLVLDNPYIGLDVESRKVLDRAVEAIAGRGVSVLMLVCDPQEIPECATAFVPMREMCVGKPVMRSNMDTGQFRRLAAPLFDYTIDPADMPPIPDTDASPENIFTLNHCRVKYGDTTLVSDISWSVNKGERWSLTGPNGSGKSTLLSLINADNPQAYSNDITIFGHRRGTGESIWEIKRRIGFVSAEMHLCFHAGNRTVAEVIAGGLLDVVGAGGHVTAAHLAEADKWIDFLNLRAVAGKRFGNVSFGEQKLVLIARALIKKPDLLILDEPMHGLDAARKRALLSVIDHIGANTGMALIFVTHYPHEVPVCINHRQTLTR